MPTISEDDVGSKPKASKSKQLKKEKADKIRKESKTNTSATNGDTSLDGLQVAVVRGQQRTNIDTIELTSFSKSKDTSDSSPLQGKHSSSLVKSSSGTKMSISNKEVKNTKSGHTRNSSVESNQPESTDL